MTSHSAVESAADARAGERKVAILSLSRASWTSVIAEEISASSLAMQQVASKPYVPGPHGPDRRRDRVVRGRRLPKSRRARGGRRTGRGLKQGWVNPQGKAEGEQGTDTNAREERESQEDPRSLAMCRTRKPKPT